MKRPFFNNKKSPVGYFEFLRAEARGWNRSLELWGRERESYRVGLGRCIQCRILQWVSLGAMKWDPGTVG